MLQGLLYSLTIACLFIAALPICYIFILTLAGLKTQKKAIQAPKNNNIAIIIPAHNESLLISQTVTIALQQDYPTANYAVFVIADNCTDNTVQEAHSAGAQILERNENPGKGQALHYAFTKLLTDKWDAFLVIDADCTLSNNALSALNNEYAQGSQALQLLDTIRNPNTSMRTLAMQMGMSSFNGLRPWGRNNIGHSAGLFGNGFSLSRDTLEKVPYLAHSIVEDLEYHIHLLRAGIKVKLLSYATAAAQMPTQATDSTSQRQRWELGRIAMIKSYSKPLLHNIMDKKSWAIEALLDVLMPPASLILLFTLPPLILGTTPMQYLALSLIAMLLFHYVCSAYLFGSLKGAAKVSLYLPWYVFWKTLLIIKSLLKNKQMPWVRTKRHREEE